MKHARDYKTDIIVSDWQDGGIRCLILSRYYHFTAYLGIPLNAILAGKHYDDIPLNVHGGLTFSQEGKGIWPKGYWWYGWDYAHGGDYTYFSNNVAREFLGDTGGDHDWTLDEVESEVKQAVKDWKKIALEMLKK